MKRTFVLIVTVSILILASSIVLSQSASPVNSNPPNTAANAQSESNINLGDNKNLREGFKSMADGSSTLVGWGLTIIAASIITIVSTSYLRPLNKKIRLIYLLFIPGWIFISLSIYFGNKISRRYIAAMLVTKTEYLDQIGEKINTEFGSQLLYFQIGLIFFSIWLLAFLLWWIFGNWSASTDKSNTGGA